MSGTRADTVVAGGEDQCLPFVPMPMLMDAWGAEVGRELILRAQIQVW